MRYIAKKDTTSIIRNPYYSLWAAVLAQAMEDLRSRKESIQQSALQWIKKVDYKICGFDWICLLFDIEPDLARKVLMHTRKFKRFRTKRIIK